MPAGIASSNTFVRSDSGLIARPVSQRTSAARTLPQPAPHPPHLALYGQRRYGTFIEVPNSYRTWIKASAGTSHTAPDSIAVQSISPMRPEDHATPLPHLGMGMR